LVTDKQVRRLLALVKTEGNQEIATARVGVDAKTARKYLCLSRVPSELSPVARWRTRPDPFVEVWENVVKGGVKLGHCGGPYIYSAAKRRVSGALRPILAPALKSGPDLRQDGLIWSA
jgi:hypothetical protein